MTVINGIEIDDIRTMYNEMNQAIDNNDPIDTALHVIIVISNPCQYARRFILAREFLRRIYPYIYTYIVELTHGSDLPRVIDPKNPRHLHIQTDTAPLWHKENLINIGVRKLFPPHWKAMAWIDADIEFENRLWALDTLKILNGSRDIVQLWSHAVDMDVHEETMNIFESFGYNYTKGKLFGKTHWHPGFAWAMTRKAWDRCGGLYDKSILGAGDHNMSLCLIGKGLESVNKDTSDGYKQSITEYQKNMIGLRLGYVPGVIRHYYHGKKKNRRYAERWYILVKHEYDPMRHVTYSKDGLLVPTRECPHELVDDVLEYFKQRNEDDL